MSAQCAEWENPAPAAFEELISRLETDSGKDAKDLRKQLAACGLEAGRLKERFCRKAYMAQDAETLLKYCHDESWSLARAQCERNLDSISPRFVEFCKAFGRQSQ